MADFGATRRGNPFSLRQHETKSNTSGEYETHYEFAHTAAICQAFLRGNGLPRRFAPRNDMLKTAVLLQVQGRFRRMRNHLRICPGTTFLQT